MQMTNMTEKIDIPVFEKTNNFGKSKKCCLQAFKKLITGHRVFNSLPNDKILDWSKLSAYADDNMKVTEKLKFVLVRVENIVEKGENAGYQHFLFFPRCFFF